MSLKSNYTYIRDWITEKFIKKEDINISNYPTHTEVSDTLKSYAEKSELDDYLRLNDYKVEENIIASALTDLDNRTDGAIREKEEKVIAISLLDINSRMENVDNKITSLSSSSTDDQYPSAKCMYDRIVAIENRLSQLEQNQGN